jgi:hypothetical protein
MRNLNRNLNRKLNRPFSLITALVLLTRATT